MIYTSYYRNVHNIEDFMLISISRKTPIAVDAYLPELNPTWFMITELNKTGDREAYTKRYTEEILSKLNPHDVVGTIRKMSMKRKAKNIALLCYENKESFCHRHLVSSWLREAGYNVKEF